MVMNYVYGDTADYGKSDNAIDVVRKGGLINEIDNSDYGVTNRPVGFSTGSAVLSRTLINGYPALADGTSLSYLFGDESADTYNAVTRQNTSSIDGLFLKDSVTGKYSYNSRESHAQYSNNFFTRYNQFLTPNFIAYPFGNFLPLNTISDLTKATQVGAFNRAGGMRDYVDAIKADLVAANNDPNDWKFSTRRQLRVMLDEYAENWNLNPNNGATWNDISPANAIRDYFQMPGDNPTNNVGFVSQAHLDRMYNIDWDVEANFFFGMEMKMQFIQPKNGYTGNDTNGDGKPDYPLEFYFTGDDDIWIYIDDVLFLDLSGIHRHVGGKIDFVNGIVSYYHLDVETGDVAATPYAWYSFAALFRAAGWTEAQIDEVLKPIENNNRPFKDYTSHTFNLYYMERGSGSSVCRMEFNFPMLKQNSISVTKEQSCTTGAAMVGDPDYSLQIMKNSDKQPLYGAGVPYYVYDASTNQLVGENPRYTEADGIFKIKAGQRAEFTGIGENTGKYYVREILDPTFAPQYDSVNVDGREIPKANWENVRGQYYGVSSEARDISDGPIAFVFDNCIDGEKLSYLTITKMVKGVDDEIAKTLNFDMRVELNGNLNGTEGWIPIPVGTPYTLYRTDLFISNGQKVKIEDNPDRVVTTEGIVTVPGGATAEIDYMIPGTTYRVYETSGSAEGYSVGYDEVWGEEWITAYEDRVEGTIPVYNESNLDTAHVCMTVTNTLPSTKVEFRVYKQLINGNLDTNAHTVSFTARCTKATDKNGTSIDALLGTGTQAKVTISGDQWNAVNFVIGYDYYKQFEGHVDVNNWPVRLIYEITEVQSDDMEYTHDATKYYVAVDINLTKVSGSWKFTATLITPVPVYENSVVPESGYATFSNTLLGDLTLEKIVEGSDSARENGSYDFTVQIGINAVTPLQNMTLEIVKNGGSVGTVNTGTNGTVNLTGVKHGDRIVLKGIPLGCVWRITETNAEGCEVSWTKSDSSGTSNVAEGSVTADGMEVVFTNEITYVYELPETGGAGTTPYTMAGLVLMLFSMAYLVCRPKARVRGTRQSP